MCVHTVSFSFSLQGKQRYAVVLGRRKTNWVVSPRRLCTFSWTGRRETLVLHGVLYEQFAVIHSADIFPYWFYVFSSLPEVPALVDVPCVSAQLDDSLLGLLRDRVSRHGSVSSHPPVQIEELQERPGGILVRWCKVSKGNTKKILQYKVNVFVSM